MFISLTLNVSSFITYRVNLSNQIQLRERASYSSCARSWRQQTNPSRKNFTIFKPFLLRTLMTSANKSLEKKFFTTFKPFLLRTLMTSANKSLEKKNFTTFKPSGWKCYKTIGSYVSCTFIEIWSTWEVWRALKKLELLAATLRATLIHLSCSPNFPRASYLDERTLTYEPIVEWSEKQQGSVLPFLKWLITTNFCPKTQETSFSRKSRFSSICPRQRISCFGVMRQNCTSSLFCVWTLKV